MKVLLIVVLTLLFSSGMLAQEEHGQEQPKTTSTANMVYGSVSFGGLLGGLSVNYERKIAKFTRGTINLRGGFARVSGWDLRGNGVTANWAYLFGHKKHHIELNLGVMGLQDRYRDQLMTNTDLFFAQWEFFPLLNAGYRLQKPEGGFMLRTGIGTELLYLGVGYSF